MQHQLEEFIRALRAADVRVSPAEAIDAARAVTITGYGDRQLFKDALCVSLAKSPDEVTRFDQTFETFFTRQALSQPPPEASEEGGENQDDASQSGAAAEGSPLAQMLLAGDAAGLAQAME